MGPTFKEGEGMWEGRGRLGKGGKTWEGEGRGRDGKGGDHQYFIAPPVPVFYHICLSRTTYLKSANQKMPTHYITVLLRDYNDD